MNKTKIKRAIFVIVACVMAFSCLKICWYLNDRRIREIVLLKDRHSLDVSVSILEHSDAIQSFDKEVQYFRIRMFYALDVVSNRIDSPIVMFCAVKGGLGSASTTCFIVTENEIFKIISPIYPSYPSRHVVSMCRLNQMTQSYIEAFRKSIENEGPDLPYRLSIVVFDAPLGFSCLRIKGDMFFSRMFMKNNSCFQSMVENLMEISFQECE